MAKKIAIRFVQCMGILFLICGSGSPLTAQTLKQNPEKKEEQLQSLRSGVGILAFTGQLRWNNFFTNTVNRGLEEKSQTELQAEFRNIHMLSSKLGIGYRAFSTVFINGFFNGVGLGSIALGPLARFYPLKSSHWQPYIQANLLAGYNLALSDALGINDAGGIRYRSGLRGGLGYKFSNAFGIFGELGPAWEYNGDFQLDSHAIQFNIGIELFRF